LKLQRAQAESAERARHPDRFDERRAAAAVHDGVAPAHAGNLQRLAGNAVAARLLAGRGPAIGRRVAATPVRLARSGVLRSVIQRHTQGVLDKINSDLTERRVTLRGQDPTAVTGGDLLEYIYKHVGEIARLPEMVTVCATKDELKAALAKDLAARAGASTVTEEHRASAANDVDNGGGGFTAMDGTVYMLESTNDSSALYHELIHVLSAPGGTTNLSKTKVNLNEGFTNYFAEQLSAKYKKATFPAYPAATAWARKFATKYGDATAYNIYFKDDEELLYTTLAGTLKTNAEADKLIHDANAKDKKKDPTRFSGPTIKTFFNGATIKDQTALATMIKGKIKAADFLDPAEANLKWLDTAIFN